MNIFKTKKENSFNIMENIENFLKNPLKQKAEVDISDLNLIDASRTALLCSVRFFAKYPDKKIRWSVKDEETKKTISNLMLKNMELEIKEHAAQNKVYSLFSSVIFATVQSLIVKREVFDKVGYFSEDLDIAEDFDLYVRLFSECSIEVLNNQYGFRYRQNPNSLMNSKDSEDKLIRGSRIIVEKINSYDFNDKKLNKKREILASLKFLDLISNIARNGNKIGARKLLGEFCFSTPRINFKILKRVAKIITII